MGYKIYESVFHFAKRVAIYFYPYKSYFAHGFLLCLRTSMGNVTLSICVCVVFTLKIIIWLVSTLNVENGQPSSTAV